MSEWKTWEDAFPYAMACAKRCRGWSLLGRPAIEQAIRVALWKGFERREFRSRPWVAILARGAIADELRALTGLPRGKHHMYSLVSDDEAPEPEVDWESGASAKIDAERALRALPPRDEAILRLRYQQQEKTKTIAVLYGTCPERMSQLYAQSIRWCRWRLGINSEHDNPRFDPEHRALRAWLREQRP